MLCPRAQRRQFNQAAKHDAAIATLARHNLRADPLVCVYLEH